MASTKSRNKPTRKLVDVYQRVALNSCLLTALRLHGGLTRTPSLPTSERENMDTYYPTKTQSLNNSPKILCKSGIPLGSLTAQLASKSFWNEGMLKSSLEKIAYTAAQESPYSASSLDSLQESETEVEQCFEREISEESVHTKENNEDRELRHPFSKIRKWHTGGCQTPPFLSPGITRRVQKL